MAQQIAMTNVWGDVIVKMRNAWRLALSANQTPFHNSLCKVSPVVNLACLRSLRFNADILVDDMLDSSLS